MVLLFGSGCVSTVLWAVRAATELDWKGNARIEFPMVRDRDGHVGIPVKVGDQDVVAFLDTGAPMSAMNLETVVAAKLPATPEEDGRQTIRDVSVQLQGASLKLPIVIASKTLRDLPLLLGTELFSKAIVEMDFIARRVTLVDPETFDEPAAKPVMVEMDHSRPVVKMRLNGGSREQCALIDTGLGSGVVLSSRDVSRLSLPTVAGRTSKYMGVDGILREAPSLAPLDQLSFAGHSYRDVPALGRATEDKKWGCENLIGMAVLSRHRVIFDLGSKRMWLLPP